MSALARAFRVLRYVVDGVSTANLSEVGRQIAVYRVTVMRMLATLEHEGVLALYATGSRIVTNSSAAVGCSPSVWSN